MEHGKVIPTPQVTADPQSDPGDFVAEEARMEAAHPNYIGVFVVLAILTLTEIGLVNLFPNTVGRIPILLFLTIAKGLLVVLYYMHLKFDSRLYSFFFGAGVFAFAVPYVLAVVFLLAPPQLASQRGQAGGGEAPVTRPTANPNAGPPVTLSVSGTEFEFTPNVESANAGQAVNIAFTNTGSVEHTWAISNKPAAEDAQPWTDDDGKVIARAQPGGSGRGGFIAPGPGVYIFYCNIPGHAQAGMVGTFTVK